MLKIKKTKFKGLLLIEGNSHKDNRGYLREILIEKQIKQKFKFQIVSKSKDNVLRGLHFQYKKPQAKFISVIKGKIFDVAVDLRKNSKTFGRYVSITLSFDDQFSFYIPEGFAHGFLCLTKNCTVNYKCSNFRSQKTEKTLSWNDKKVNIKWPTKKPILSVKDQNGLNLNHFI